MDYRYLAAFKAVAKHQSLTRAAEELQIAVSAVSRQLSLFEASVGQKLFMRQARKIVLAQCGQFLLDEINRFDHSAQRLLLPGDQHKKIRVGCLQSVFEELLLPYIQNQLSHSKMAIPMDVEVSTPQNLIERLKQSQLDVVLVTIQRKTMGIDSICLYDECPCLASVEPALPSSAKVIFSPYEEYWPDSLSFEDGMQFKVNSLNAAIELAKAGAGPTVIPFAMAKKHKFKHIKKLSAKSAYIYFCTEKHTQPQLILRQLLAQLRRLKRV